DDLVHVGVQVHVLCGRVGSAERTEPAGEREQQFRLGRRLEVAQQIFVDGRGQIDALVEYFGPVIRIVGARSLDFVPGLRVRENVVRIGEGDDERERVGV